MVDAFFIVVLFQTKINIGQHAQMYSKQTHERVRLAHLRALQQLLLAVYTRATMRASFARTVYSNIDAWAVRFVCNLRKELNQFHLLHWIHAFRTTQVWVGSHQYFRKVTPRWPEMILRCRPGWPKMDPRWLIKGFLPRLWRSSCCYASKSLQQGSTMALAWPWMAWGGPKKTLKWLPECSPPRLPW